MKSTHRVPLLNLIITQSMKETCYGYYALRMVPIIVQNSVPCTTFAALSILFAVRSHSCVPSLPSN